MVSLLWENKVYLLILYFFKKKVKVFNFMKENNEIDKSNNMGDNAGDDANHDRNSERNEEEA